MKEHTQESSARVGLQAGNAAENSTEKSPEARGLSQTMRDPARRKRNASGKNKDRCSPPDRRAGTNGTAHESSSPNGAPNGAEASGKRNGREISGSNTAASDDASGTTAAGAATSAATCAVRDACAEVAELDPNAAANHKESGTVDDRRPRAPGDSEQGREPHEPLALDAPGFVDEMHARVNLYEVMRELLEAEDLKVKQRAMESLLEMKYGKGAAMQAEEPPRIELDLPRPQR